MSAAHHSFWSLLWVNAGLPSLVGMRSSTRTCCQQPNLQKLNLKTPLKMYVISANDVGIKYLHKRFPTLQSPVSLRLVVVPLLVLEVGDDSLPELRGPRPGEDRGRRHKP